MIINVMKIHQPIECNQTNQPTNKAGEKHKRDIYIYKEKRDVYYTHIVEF